MTALLSFLVLGPMIDVKNTILLSRFLKPHRLLSLVALIFVVTGGINFILSSLWAVTW